ncbi:MAG: ATP-binding protein [Polyangiaceae bacterium]
MTQPPRFSSAFELVLGRGVQSGRRADSFHLRAAPLGSSNPRVRRTGLDGRLDPRAMLWVPRYRRARMPRRVPPRPRATRLFLATAIGLTAVAALCGTAVGAYVSATRWANHAIDVRGELYEWLTAVLDAQSGAHGCVASSRPVFLDAYEAALSKERAKASLVQRLIVDNPAQSRSVEAADRDAQAVMEDLRELVGAVKAGHRDDAVAALESGRNRRLMEAFRDDLRNVRTEEQRLVVERRGRARTWGVTASVSAIVLGLGSFGLLMIAWRRERQHDGTVTAMAIDARGRLEGLSELAAELSNALTRTQVAEVIVEYARRAAGADICTLHQLNDAATLLELLGERGVALEVLEKIRRIASPSGESGPLGAMKSAIWAENEGEYAAIYPALAKIQAEGRRAKAFWSVPLVAEGRCLGLLGMGFYEPRTFSADERAFIETLSKLCAQSLLRASRMEREEQAQRWLATTLRSIGDAVIATDAEGRVTFMNAVAETLTGWRESDSRGRPLAEVFSIFSEETGAPVESPADVVLRDGVTVGFCNHTVLRSKDGSHIPIDDSGAPIRNEGGRVLGVVLVFRDVTNRKREQARAEFLAKAGDALGSSIDYQSTLTTVARSAVPALADWCAVDLVRKDGKSLERVAVAHADEGKIRLALELGERYPQRPDQARGVYHVLRTGSAELYPEISATFLEGLAKDAEHLRLMRELRLRSAMIIPLRAGGRTLGAMTFVHAESGRHYTRDDLAFAEDFARRAAMAIENASALRQMEEAKAEERMLRSEAERANRAKDEFLATVSHELRTPLNAILGWTLMARRRSVPGEVDRALSIVERNARLQTKLIEDVLDISRIISGKLVLALGPTNVADAVLGAVETVTPAAEAKNIAISIDVPDRSLTIVADADRLQQIVWNLLSNAVKFTPKGGQVTVRAHREGSEVRIHVSDTGEGIPRDALPIVFQPFQQADSSTTRRHGGLGLGLAIVAQLVAAHGGTAEAQSEGEGRGATFIVRLPARSALPAISRAAPSSGAMERAASAVDRVPRLDGLRLLVVDDEEDALDLVRTVLEEQGADVYVAASAREALERFAEVRPDVIVSDIGMPETDGLSFIRKIRALSAAQGGRTPAVALTAYARREDAQRAFAAGYQMHVAKPAEPVQLVTVVANLGGRSLEGANP